MSLPSALSDRNLLFGILALQVNFVTRDALIQGMNAWVLDKHRRLGEILVEQGALRQDLHDVVDVMVQKHVEVHGGDVKQSLAALRVEPAISQDLARVESADVRDSLASLTPLKTNPDGWGTSPHLPDPAPSTTRFWRLREHAKGGLGEVFLALDRELHREVALKEIQGQYADHPDSRSRFVLEAEVTGNLEHPGIVPVYGLGAYPDGRPYYAMRFIRGKSMHEVIAQFHKADSDPHRDDGERSVALRELLIHFVTVCNAVAYAHSRGVIHRDIKPANVMLGEYGETLVVDWGLARLRQSSPGEQVGVDRPVLPATGRDIVATSAGQVVGTLAYMPPEQAEGQLDRVGVASDVFALGATLYSLLTGQAPYQGEDMLGQARRCEWVPARQRKQSVPAALEAVCGRAMARRIQDRYPTAKALAQDVQRWLAGEPVSAWPEPLTVKVGRWVRKNRVLASSAAAAAVVALVLGTAAGVYRQQQRMRASEQAEVGLAQADRLRDEYRFVDALAMLAQVRGWAAQAADRELDSRLDRAENDLKLMRALDDLRQKSTILIEGKWDLAPVLAEYPKVMARYGLDVSEGDLEELAEKIRASAARDSIVAALDFWARSEGNTPKGHRLARLANRADEADPWRQAVRAALVRGNKEELRQLAGTSEKGKPTASVVLLLSAGLGKGKDSEQATILLRQMQQEQPRDFWVNLDLGHHCYELGRYREASECFRLAVTLRPDSAPAHANLGLSLNARGRVDEAIACYHRAIKTDDRFAGAHNNLGLALSDKGKLDEAIASYHKAIEVDPTFSWAYNNLGNVLKQQGKVDEAIASYRQAIAFAPRDSVAHYNLGTALNDRGQVDEAIVHLRKAIQLDPDYAYAHSNLGVALKNKGQLDEALACCKKAIKLDPDLAPAHNGLGTVLQAKGHLDEAIASYRHAIELDPHYPLPHNNLGTTLLDKGKRNEAIACFKRAIDLDPRFGAAHGNLGNTFQARGKLDEAIACYRKAIAYDPGHPPTYNNLGLALKSKGKVDEAVASYRKAIALDPRLASAHFNLGLALRQQGKLDEAVACFGRAVQLDPDNAADHEMLGIALMQKGEFMEAHKVLRRCLALLPPDHPGRESVLARIRQCRQLRDVDARLNSFLAGNGAPADAAAQVPMAQLAQQPYRRLYLISARLYRDAFVRQPSLAEVHRFDAACAAALAGTGQGKDAGELDDRQRGYWRQQALTWLVANLTGYGALVKKTDGLPLVRQRLDTWLKHPDLAGVRDEPALAKLPEKEREAWRKLWADVAVLLKQVEQGGASR